MCDPITAIGIAATVAGTGLQMKAQSDARKKSKQVMQRTARENNKLVDKNSKALADAREGFKREGEGGFDSALSNDISALATKYQDAQSSGQIPGEFARGKTEAPQIVKQYEENQRGKAKDFSNEYAQALASMAGLDETMFGRNIKTQRAGEVFDMDRSFMAGNNNVAQQQLASISNSSPLGDLLSLGGSLAMGYGMKAPAGGPVPIKVGGATPMPAKLPPLSGMPTFGGLY